MSNKRSFSSHSSENNNRFIKIIQENINNNLEKSKPFIHGRLSPFRDVALEKGRESPFNENGLYENNKKNIIDDSVHEKNINDENINNKNNKKNPYNEMDICN